MKKFFKILAEMISRKHQIVIDEDDIAWEDNLGSDASVFINV